MIDEEELIEDGLERINGENEKCDKLKLKAQLGLQNKHT